MMVDVSDHRAPAARVWTRLHDEARDVAARDPFLARRLEPALLMSGSLQEALSHRLAEVLAGPDCPAHELQTLFQQVLEAQPSIPDATARDLCAVRRRDPTCPSHLHAFLNYKGFHALQIYRLAHAQWHSGQRELASWVSNRASAFLGPDIHPAARLGAGIVLDHGSGIVIGETAVVEDDVTLLQNVTLGGTGKTLGDRHPKVRTGAMIGAGAVVLGNIEIGADSKVGAGSVVLQDVPRGCTAVGVPARIVRQDVPRSLRASDGKTTARAFNGMQGHIDTQAKPSEGDRRLAPLQGKASSTPETEL